MIYMQTKYGSFSIDELTIFNWCLDGSFQDYEHNQCHDISLDKFYESLLSKIVIHYNYHKQSITDYNKTFLISCLIDDFRSMKSQNIPTKHVLDATEFLLMNRVNLENFPYYITVLTLPKEIDDTFDSVYHSIFDRICLNSKILKAKNFDNKSVKMYIAARECLELFAEENTEASMAVFKEQMCYVISYLAKNDMDINNIYEIFDYIRDHLTNLNDYFEFNKTMDPRELKILENSMVEGILEELKGNKKEIIK